MQEESTADSILVPLAGFGVSCYGFLIDALSHGRTRAMWSFLFLRLELEDCDGWYLLVATNRVW